MMSGHGTGPSLPEQVMAFSRRHNLWRPGDRLLVALSGGADSVALLHVLSVLAERERLELVAAHVNYGLRGGESDGDEAHCRALCDSLAVPLEVMAAPGSPQAGVQAWARRIRYGWFVELAEEHSCRRIALGHTAGDRAETVILQLLRGAARRGVGNMQPAAGRQIRPLLECDRSTIEAYLQSHGVAYRADTSNSSPKYRRNRVRHEVLPLLTDVFAKNAVQALADSAHLFTLEADYLEQEASRHAQLLERACGGLRIEAAALRELHPALALQLLKSALAQWHIRPRLHTLLRLLELAGRPAGKRLRLGRRGMAERSREYVWLYERREELPEVPVQVPGVTSLPDGSLLRVEVSQPDKFPRGDYAIAARLAGSPSSLRVRAARAGDRIRPFGMQGSRLVFDLLSEAGVPRFLRPQSWVLEDREHILWLLGHRPAEDIRVLPGQGEVYQFRWETEAKA